MNIGYADALGSGVRNLYRFTKIYSGGEPDFEEGDVFKLTVPLEQHHGVKEEVKTYGADTVLVTEEVTERVTEGEKQVTDILRKNPACTSTMLAEMLGISRKTVSKRMKSLKEKGIVERKGSDRKGYWKIYL